MPIFSYLVHPKPGAKQQLLEALSEIDHCEVMPAGNQDLMVLVTDTPDDTTEEKLQKQINGLEFIQDMSMTFGYLDEPKNDMKKR